MKEGGLGGRRLWILFAIGAAAVLAVMASITRKMIDLERGETQAKYAAAYQQKLRVALWRLDHAFSEMLRREAERPPDAYAALLDKPDYIRLHFQVDAGGTLSSPQVNDTLPAETLALNCSTLSRIEGLVGEGDVKGRLEQAEKQTATLEKLRLEHAESTRMLGDLRDAHEALTTEQATTADRMAERQARNEWNLRTLEELRAAQDTLRAGHEGLRSELALAQGRGAEAEARLAELRASHETLLADHATIVREIEAVTDRLKG